MAQTLSVDFGARRQRLREKLQHEQLDAQVIWSGENRYYLSGFSGSTGWLVVSAQGAHLIADGRYWNQAAQQCPEVELVKFVPDQDLWWGNCFRALQSQNGWRRIGFEPTIATVADHKKMLELAGSAWTWCEAEGLSESLRQCKDGFEQDKMRQAARIADRALRVALESLKVGMSEHEFCLELEYQTKKLGARKPSFDSIVASGPNGAQPHAGVTAREIRAGELITLDFGAYLDGYCSDMTRTVWLGQLDPTSKEVYKTVREAHKRALNAVAPGVATKELDRIAREVVENSPFKGMFKHGLGHGVGLMVHEKPAVRGSSSDILEPGMVITIEPGIYIDEGFPVVTGCRVEDSVLVTSDGFEYLTQSPYQEIGQTHPLDDGGDD